MSSLQITSAATAAPLRKLSQTYFKVSASLLGRLRFASLPLPQENTTDPAPPPQINNSRHPPVNTVKHYSQPSLELRYSLPPAAAALSPSATKHRDRSRDRNHRAEGALLIFLVALDNRNGFRRRRGGGSKF